MDRENIKVLHTVAALKTASGGPARTVSSLCEYVGRLGASVELVTQDYSSEDTNIATQPEFVTTTYVQAINIPQLRLIYAPSFKTTLLNRCPQTKIRLIHDQRTMADDKSFCRHCCPTAEYPFDSKSERNA